MAKRQRDETGMLFAGRSDDGRYRYHVPTPNGGWADVALTQQQRVNFAIMRRTVALVTGSELYPFRDTLHGRCGGWGIYGGSLIWIARRRADPITERTWRIIAHELAHNSGLHHTPKREFDAKCAEWYARLASVTCGFTRLPQPDMRKLRDTTPPQVQARERKAALREAKAAETPAQRWRKKLTHAEQRRVFYAREAERMGRLLAKWEKEERKAHRWLKQAEEKERRE